MQCWRMHACILEMHHVATSEAVINIHLHITLERRNDKTNLTKNVRWNLERLARLLDSTYVFFGAVDFILCCTCGKCQAAVGPSWDRL
jgi:hypothetical protein